MWRSWALIVLVQHLKPENPTSHVECLVFFEVHGRGNGEWCIGALKDRLMKGCSTGKMA